MAGPACVGLAPGFQQVGEQRLDLAARRALVHVAKAHTDARRAVADGRRWRDPDDLAGHRQLFLGVHQAQHQEYLVAQAVVLGGRDEQAAVLDERHVGGIKGTGVPYGQGQDPLTRIVGYCAHRRSPAYG